MSSSDHYAKVKILPRLKNSYLSRFSYLEECKTIHTDPEQSHVHTAAFMGNNSQLDMILNTQLEKSIDTQMDFDRSMMGIRHLKRSD